MRMKPRARSLGLWVLLMVATPCMGAEAPDAGELTRMLHEFLAGATVNDVAAHERFWAPDLVYTSSSGERFGKAEILEGLKASPEPPEGEPALVYSAEDIRIQQYGDAAVVAFMLLGSKSAAGAAGTPPGVQRFFNTGTFVRRDGTWQAVAWQATRIPEASQ